VIGFHEWTPLVLKIKTVIAKFPRKREEGKENKTTQKSVEDLTNNQKGKRE